LLGGLLQPKTTGIPEKASTAKVVATLVAQSYKVLQKLRFQEKITEK